VDDVLALVRRIAVVEVDDGLVFDSAAAAGSSIRDEDRYAGVRVSLPCALASARIRFHFDVNVGDPIWPAPGLVGLPRVLGGRCGSRYLLAMVFAKIVTAVRRACQYPVAGLRRRHLLSWAGRTAVSWSPRSPGWPNTARSR
jgi:hypothetical protein